MDLSGKTCTCGGGPWSDCGVCASCGGVDRGRPMMSLPVPFLPFTSAEALDLARSETEGEYQARVRAWGVASCRVMNLLWILREKMTAEELRDAILRVPVDGSSLVPMDPALKAPSNDRMANLLTGLLWRAE